MSACEICGNENKKPLEIYYRGAVHTFDGFECAVRALATTCVLCGCKFIKRAGRVGRGRVRPVRQRRASLRLGVGSGHSASEEAFDLVLDLVEGVSRNAPARDPPDGPSGRRSAPARRRSTGPMDVTDATA